MQLIYIENTLFLTIQGNLHHFHTKKDAFIVLGIEGTKLDFPSETYDITFSFSSILHFGGRIHSYPQKSIKEIGV